MSRADYENCGPHQDPQWWSERCGGCDHMLAVHRTIEAVMVCDMCALAAEVTTAAQGFAQELKAQAVGYVDTKQAEAKTYVDSQNSTQNTQVQGWVNNRLVQSVKAEALKIDPRTTP